MRAPHCRVKRCKKSHCPHRDAGRWGVFTAEWEREDYSGWSGKTQLFRGMFTLCEFTNGAPSRVVLSFLSSMSGSRCGSRDHEPQIHVCPWGSPTLIDTKIPRVRLLCEETCSIIARFSKHFIFKRAVPQLPDRWSRKLNCTLRANDQ